MRLILSILFVFVSVFSFAQGGRFNLTYQIQKHLDSGGNPVDSSMVWTDSLGRLVFINWADIVNAISISSGADVGEVTISGDTIFHISSTGILDTILIPKASWLLAASGTGGTEAITDGETVTITGTDGIEATRSVANVTLGLDFPVVSDSLAQYFPSETVLTADITADTSHTHNVDSFKVTFNDVDEWNINGDTPNTLFESINSGSGQAIRGQSTSNNGITGSSSTGRGVHASSTTGLPIYGSLFSGATNNDTRPLLQLDRFASGLGADGIGSRIDFLIEASDGFGTVSNEIISEWLVADAITRTSNFRVSGVNSGTKQNILSVYGTGQLTLPEYDGTQFIGTSTDSILTVNTVTGDVRLRDASLLGGPIPISDLLAADGTNTIDNTGFTQTWNWNAIPGTGLKIASTSTAAAASAQKLVDIELSGANASASQTTMALEVSNTHTGTTPNNFGISVNVSGGLTNRGVYSQITGLGSALYGDQTATSGSTVTPILILEKSTSGTPAAGLGSSIDFLAESTSSTDMNQAAIQSLWTDATHATRTSALDFYTVNSATLARKMRLAGDGRLTLDGYITGSFGSTDAADSVMMINKTTGVVSYKNQADFGGGSSVSFGTDNQIPFTNLGGTDFDYSANFTMSGTAFGVDNSTVVFNESGADVDFRVEGAGAPNALFVDGANGRVGINTGLPSELLEIGGSSPAVRVTAADAVGVTRFRFYETTTNKADFQFVGSANAAVPERNWMQFVNRTTTGGIGFWTNGGERISILSDGKVGIGINPPQTNLHIQESTTDVVPTIEVEQLSTGDAGLQLSIPGDSYSLAIDNSDNDLLKVSYAAAAGTAVAGTNDVMAVAPTGFASPATSITLGVGVTTFAVTSNVITLTGDVGANTIATITAGISGQILTLIFTDALVTITDDGTATANTVNLSAAFTSAANTTLTLVSDGNSWFETSRSVN